MTETEVIVMWLRLRGHNALADEIAAGQHMSVITEHPWRTCPDCKTAFPLGPQHWQRVTNNKSGWSNRCRKCLAAKRRGKRADQLTNKFQYRYPELRPGRVVRYKRYGNYVDMVISGITSGPHGRRHSLRVMGRIGDKQTTEPADFVMATAIFLDESENAA